MSCADDRERQIFDRCEILHNATGNPISLHKTDFEFLRGRGKLRANGADVIKSAARLDGTDIPVVKRS